MVIDESVGKWDLRDGGEDEKGVFLDSLRGRNLALDARSESKESVTAVFPSMTGTFLGAGAQDDTYTGSIVFDSADSPCRRRCKSEYPSPRSVNKSAARHLGGGERETIARSHFARSSRVPVLDHSIPSSGCGGGAALPHDGLKGTELLLPHSHSEGNAGTIGSDDSRKPSWSPAMFAGDAT